MRAFAVFLLAGCMGDVVGEPAPPPVQAVPDAGLERIDSGTPDAGTVIVMVPDAGTFEPSDAGTFFGAARCTSDLLICDDFEGETIDPAIWSYTAGSGTGFAAVDTTQAARGSKALHLRSGVQVHAKDAWPFMANGFYLRAFMYWGQPIADWHRTYFWAIDPSQSAAFTLGSYHGQLGINEYGPNNGDTGVAARDNLPVGRWACVEWQVNPANDEVHVWVDEAEVPAEAQNPFQVPDMHVTNWAPMMWNELVIEMITSTPTDELWIDSLAVDSARIGCSR